MPTPTQQFAGLLRDSMTEKEFQNILAAINQSSQWGLWNNVPFDSSLFFPDAGTWTPTPDTVRRLKWTLINRTMIVDIYISQAPITGTVKYLSVRIPNTGYKIVAPLNAPPTVGIVTTSATTTARMIDNGAGVFGALTANGARTDGIILVGLKNDASAFTNNAGILGQIAFEVQPQ